MQNRARSPLESVCLGPSWVSSYFDGLPVRFFNRLKRLGETPGHPSTRKSCGPSAWAPRLRIPPWWDVVRPKRSAAGQTVQGGVKLGKLHSIDKPPIGLGPLLRRPTFCLPAQGLCRTPGPGVHPKGPNERAKTRGDSAGSLARPAPPGPRESFRPSGGLVVPSPTLSAVSNTGIRVARRHSRGSLREPNA